jgi:hypothetical protein
MKHRHTIFHARVGPVRIPQNPSQDMLRRTSLFAPVGYVGQVVHSGASGTQNVDVLFFILGWNQYESHQKRVGTRYAKLLFLNHVGTHYAELVFLHPVGSAGHVVHSDAFKACTIEAPFFMLRWDHYRFDKKRIGTRHAELLFLHLVGSVGHIVHSGASRA